LIPATTGGTSNSAAVTKLYVDTAITAEDFWDRTNTTLSPNTASDNVSIAGDLTVNTDALFVDASAKRVLIGTTTEGYVAADDLTIANSADCGITIRSGSSDKARILFSDATTGAGEYAGYFVYDHSTNALTLGTSSTDWLTVDSSGSVLIGGILPASPTITLTGSTGAATFAGTITAASAIRAPGIYNTNEGGGVYFVTSSGSHYILPLWTDGNYDTSGSIKLGSATYPFGSITAAGALTLNGSGGSNAWMVYDGGTCGAQVTYDGTYRAGSISGANANIVLTGSTGAASFAGDLTINTDALFVDGSAKRVGIGTTSPSQYLDLESGSTTAARVTAHGFMCRDNWGSATSLGNGIFSSAANTLAFATNSTEAMRIDSLGRLLVGLTSARTNYYGSLASNLQVQGSSFAAISCHATSGNGAFILGRDSVISGSNIGNLSWQGNDGSTMLQTASISSAVDGTPGTNDMPGRLMFATTADGASSPTERMRIDSSGNVGINESSPDSTLHVTGPVSGTILTLDRAGSYSWKLGQSSGSALTFTGDTNERMRIDSSGRLLLGTPSAPTTGGQAPYAKISSFGNTYDNNAAGYINIGRNETAANMSSGNGVGGLIFPDSAGGQFAQIDCFADGTPGANNYPGRLVFSTTADGASSPTERMRIDSSGKIILPTLSPGIQFGSSDTGTDITSQTLDDYEEGTFTPTLTDYNGVADVSPAYDSGNYVKIGNIVTVTYYSSSLSITHSGTSSACIANMPFTCWSATGHYPVAAFTHTTCFSTSAGSAATNIQNGYMSTGSTSLYVNNETSTYNAQWSTGGYLMFSITYRTA